LNHEDASAAALRRFDVIDVVQPRARLQIDDECSPAQNRLRIATGRASAGLEVATLSFFGPAAERESYLIASGRNRPTAAKPQ